jgi:(+)-trans-carveol dehydrogenase
MIDVNLTGVWHTAKAAIPHLRAAGGGSIVITSSAAGLKGNPNAAHYTAAKHGVVGLMRMLANEPAADMIRVNTVHPSAVDTVQVHNQALYHLARRLLVHEQACDRKRRLRAGLQRRHAAER